MAEAGADPAGKNILIIGAGGAARSISFLLGEYAENLRIINRTAEKAEKLAAEIAGGTGCGNISGGGFSTGWEDLADADIIVQTTELGMGQYKDTSFFDRLERPAGVTKEEMIRTHLKDGAFVFDIVYNPQKTKFLAEAEKAGAKTVNGVMMLVCQGAEAFEIWTEKKPDLDVMRKAVLKSLERKE